MAAAVAEDKAHIVTGAVAHWKSTQELLALARIDNYNDIFISFALRNYIYKTWHREFGRLLGMRKALLPLYPMAIDRI